jgi:predicted DCC family thiol-disulfide oxidoreductase YuxK
MSVESMPSQPETHPVLLYDGVCGFCNRLVQFVLKRDRTIFRFASLQSGLAKRVLARHEVNAADLNAAYVVLGYDPDQADGAAETVLAGPDAVLFVARQLGGIWRLGAAMLGVLPHGIRAWAYGIFARYRYRVFGKYDACPLPSEETRARFLDL